MSLRGTDELFGGSLVPSRISLDSYEELFTGTPFLGQLANSLIVACLAIPAQVIISLLAGYGFAMLDFPLKRSLFWVTLSGMFVPSLLALVPSFFVVSRIGLYDSLLAIVVLHVADPFGVVLAFAYLVQTVSTSMVEATRLESASDLRVFTKIILPNCVPLIVILASLGFLSCWNDIMSPVIFLDSEQSFPVSLGIERLTLPYGEFIEGVQMAACTVATLPVLIVFFITAHRIGRTGRSWM